VAALRQVTELPLDVHLMIEEPDRYLLDFAAAGATTVTVHVETCPHLHRTVQHMRQLGLRPGVTLNPATSLDTLYEILPYVDQVLVMTVNPGFGGQSYIPTMTDKIARLARMIAERKCSAEIEVDGGIDTITAPEVVLAGARILVTGTAVYACPGGVVEGIRLLREAVTATA
jgi:ribulose-phosphate 3-epimerase